MDKVTVIDITRRCGVNRNTFYYHFHDIYELLDLIFKEEVERLLSISNEEFSTWQESFCEGISWCMSNSAAIYNIYRSSGRERLEQYLIQAGRISGARYVRDLSKGFDIGQRKAEDLTHVVGAAITGIVFEWINSGMQGDPRKFIFRISEFSDAFVKAAVGEGAGH